MWDTDIVSEAQWSETMNDGRRFIAAGWPHRLRKYCISEPESAELIAPDFRVFWEKCSVEPYVSRQQKDFFEGRSLRLVRFRM
jgi:hypothetical protein